MFIYFAYAIYAMEVYDDMAEYYDLAYSDQLDADFYLREARNARGAVLEVACGTGRILLRLLSEGIDAMGIDTSEKMLAVLRRKAESMGVEPKALKADMLDFKMDKRFRLIMIPYRSFLHLKDDSERKKALLNFREHLEAGGRLIIHTYNPSKDELEMVDGFHLFESEEMATEDGRRYKVDWHLHYEPKGRIGRYKIVLTFENGESHEFSMELHYVLENDMQKLLQACGYKNIRLYCGFDYDPYDENCREALWFAEK